MQHSQRFRNESRTWKKEKGEIGGAGGVVKRKLYVQPEVNLGIGDRKVILKTVAIYTSKMGTSHDDVYGNLGQDVVANFDSFTIDFPTMTFYLGEPLGSDKPQ